MQTLNQTHRSNLTSNDLVKQREEQQHFSRRGVNFLSWLSVCPVCVCARVHVGACGYHTSSEHLFQRGVRDTVAAEAKVGHGLVELSEKHSKGSVCGAAVGQDVGDLLTNALQEERLGDVAQHQLTKGRQVCGKRNNGE